jgi:asparagine N-glycosylation enzyme membrane subunit Stt3
MDHQTMIKIGGFYNLGFAVFHIMFWKIFHWKTDLPKLTRINRAVMQVLNLCLTFCLIFFGYISIFYSGELIASKIGQALLLFIALFWLARAIEQVIFFDYRRPVSIALTIVFLLGSFLYAYPLLF